MARVICKRPNASDEISGVKFEQHDDGMLSEEISDEQAAAFCEIDGYELVAGESKPHKAAEGKGKGGKAAKHAEPEAQPAPAADAGAGTENQ